MRFCLFSERCFEVKHPVALVEAYCFQSDFYKNYDLLLRKNSRSLLDVNKVGGRIQEGILSECAPILQRYEKLPIFEFDLDSFLKEDEDVRKNHINGLSQLVYKLKKVKGIALSTATKILHTLHPDIIPIIDNSLKREYKIIKGIRKPDLEQLFADYYDNFLKGNTLDNLKELQDHLSHLNLTKVRIFDILWWSYLKAKQIDVNWRTIQNAPPH